MRHPRNAVLRIFRSRKDRSLVPIITRANLTSSADEQKAQWNRDFLDFVGLHGWRCGKERRQAQLAKLRVEILGNVGHDGAVNP